MATFLVIDKGTPGMEELIGDLKEGEPITLRNVVAVPGAMSGNTIQLEVSEITLDSKPEEGGSMGSMKPEPEGSDMNEGLHDQGEL